MKRHSFSLPFTSCPATPVRTRSAGYWLLAAALGAMLGFGSPAPALAQAGSDNPHGSLEADCSDCHSAEGWDVLREPLLFDHSSTGFTLDSAHREVACLSCHADLRFSFVGTACADCHVDPHLGELGFQCETCHTATTWDNRRSLFDIHSASLFPLEGAHAVVDCESCHREDPPFEFFLTPTDCFSCHVTDYESTTSPNHVNAGFSTTCENCHNTRAWDDLLAGANFEHDLFFPLRGAHAVLDCTDCHASDDFGGLDPDCYSCHRADYESTRDPNHVRLGFPTECQNCHGTTMWEGATSVDHNTFFPLIGVHAVLDCSECHADGFEGTPDDCFSCHQADYNQTTDPNHAAAGFSTMCEECHTPSGWEGAAFNHDMFFRLDGAHRTLDCEDCHENGFSGTPTDCYACHRADYEATTNPNHEQAGFPTSCENCHSTSTWEGATEVDHDQFFPLTGAHRSLDCDDCHAEGFPGTPTDCYSCHQDDYQQTTNPDHQEAGFPTMCETCHTTNAWVPADFDHDEIWPLTGEHRSLDCEDCHENGFDNTPTDCYSCHQDDYNETTDPNHQAAGFPTMCELCHTTSGWEPANFNHDGLYFPIYSGPHEGEWDSCADCHVNPNNFQVFECIFCHEHNREEMDDEHEDVNGYVYESQACFQCHPDGRE